MEPKNQNKAEFRYRYGHTHAANEIEYGETTDDRVRILPVVHREQREIAKPSEFLGQR